MNDEDNSVQQSAMRTAPCLRCVAQLRRAQSHDHSAEECTFNCGPWCSLCAHHGHYANACEVPLALKFVDPKVAVAFLQQYAAKRADFQDALTQGGSQASLRTADLMVRGDAFRLRQSEEAAKRAEEKQAQEAKNRAEREAEMKRVQRGSMMQRR